MRLVARLVTLARVMTRVVAWVTAQVMGSVVA